MEVQFALLAGIALLLTVQLGPAVTGAVGRWLLRLGRFRDAHRIEELAGELLGAGGPRGFLGRAGFRFPGVLMLTLERPVAQPAPATSSPPPRRPRREGVSEHRSLPGMVDLYLYHLSDGSAVDRAAMEGQLAQVMGVPAGIFASDRVALGWTVVEIDGRRVVLAERLVRGPGDLQLRQFLGTYSRDDGWTLVVLSGEEDAFDRSDVERLFSLE